MNKEELKSDLTNSLNALSLEKNQIAADKLKNQYYFLKSLPSILRMEGEYDGLRLRIEHWLTEMPNFDSAIDVSKDLTRETYRLRSEITYYIDYVKGMIDNQ